MHELDQRVLENQYNEYLTAREAAALLGVKLPTLYAYTSRGLIRSVAGPKGRTRRYLRAVLLRVGGNVSQAARETGMLRQAFQRLLRRHEVCPKEFRQARPREA